MAQKKCNWLITLTRETKEPSITDSGEIFSNHEISQVIVDSYNDADAMTDALKYIETLRSRTAITNEPFNFRCGLQDWTVLYSDDLSKYSVFKCNIEITAPAEICYTDLNRVY